MQKALVICGPTATGKTNLALALAAQFPAELISADSRQIYAGMDIGTGKDFCTQNPMHERTISFRFHDQQCSVYPYEQNGILLWMYDLVNPDEQFSVSHYYYYVKNIIEDIWRRRKLPIIVGGTGLYLRALLEGISTITVAPDAALRASALSLEKLQDILQTSYPDVWKSLNDSDRQNSRRLIRRLEIARAGGKTETIAPLLSDVLIFGLHSTREDIQNRIVKRVHERVHQGMENEIRRLAAAGYDWNLPALQGLGYKEWQPYIDTLDSLTEENREHIMRQWILDEQKYAKRQETWFRKKPDHIQWIDVTTKDYIKEVQSRIAAWYTNRDDSHEN